LKYSGYLELDNSGKKTANKNRPIGNSVWRADAVLRWISFPAQQNLFHLNFLFSGLSKLSAKRQAKRRVSQAQNQDRLKIMVRFETGMQDKEFN
jgi:hypothetical protein